VLALLLVILHMGFLMHALVRCGLDRFWLGAFAGLMRALLSTAGIIASVKLIAHGLAPAQPPSTATVPALIFAATAIVGPLTSFAIVFVAYRRTRNIPALQEEKRMPVLTAWIPVALLDVVYTVLAIGGAVSLLQVP
jgi:hypothetical protein